MRTIAILWVSLFHYAVFWTPSGKGLPLLPYGDALAWIPMADVGYFGVYLFFVVSGFVIFLSLERSKGPMDFALMRGIRLWPTLLICGSLTFGLTSLLGPAPLERSVAEYLISLTFLPPAHVGKIIGQDGFEWLDGAYWSLWTEVRFYTVAAVLFFLGRNRFLALWFGFALVCSAIFLVGTVWGGAFDALSRLLFAEHQPYFSAGIALAVLRRNPHPRLARVLLAVAILQAFTYAVLNSASGITPSHILGLIFVFALASHAMLAHRSFPFLSSRLMVLGGYASYAYYLLHQNAGMALLGFLSAKTAVSGVILMLLIQAGLLVLAITLTLWIEAPLRRNLRQLARTRVRATAA
ncbi:acyltransferase family protein [Ruegeria marina]|uniref:acyltransferase family protein n=1 Tax=Ruegeria marina TaxID=639004 RepID=UPI0015A094E0|nr:acyltransferase [Ruegeria marina]